ncbi:bifunctional salicylyl-CoA 5-hydroxylase/oxidoreductase [Ferrovibrio xuzhouensis]|uniref:Bifunctional salicylyl-CoA 5-hydroxylase/oxidoreductase n=1 Tax=Ferrovibrio xuzhouensis TaxID=1576914 RepID=A0ABV7VLE0_9PROT
MRVTIVGAGPAGLYLALLLKKADPRHDITIHERNRADDTFGFGVVFSDETLNQFLAEDADTHQAIRDSFAYWHEIDVVADGERIRSGGHGFCGLARKKLLQILQAQCIARGVTIHFESEQQDFEALRRDSDLLVGADGINSLVRDHWKGRFGPSLDWRRNRFVWLGTTLPLDTFTFIFQANEHGLFQVHAYRFEDGLSTFIVETTEETWRRTGLEQASEADTIAYCETLFAPHLLGHRLIGNRSIWRSFPTVKCENWVHENVVLIGDAVHTAHFSIGSGTKLAMEDAIALSRAIQAHPQSAPAALQSFEAGRKTEVSILQHAAQVSLEWFEHTDRYRSFAPIQLAFSLLSRSKRVTYDNLRLRDPGFVATVDRWFADQAARDLGMAAPAVAPPPMFTPFRLRDMTLDNRVVVSPMCQYSAEDGLPNDWTLVHLGSRAVGGAGLVITEMTDIAPEARITPGCTGLWSPAQARAWRRITDFVHAHSRAKIAVQLAHAGRKGATCLPWAGGYDQPLPAGGWEIVAASAIPYLPDSRVPRAMTRADMDQVRDDFVGATRLALDAGFDMIELHMAHGYLLSSFISPLSNIRDDEYGGSLESRMRFPLEVFDAVRAVWPAERPMSVRLSAVDWVPERGLTIADSVAIAAMLKAHGCDLVDVSAGQTSAEAKPQYGRMFQTPFADAIRQEAGIATIAIGAITSADQVNTILAAGRADLCALARPHLADPYFTLHAAADYDWRGVHWPVQYAAGRDQLYQLKSREREEAAAAGDVFARQRARRDDA